MFNRPLNSAIDSLVAARRAVVAGWLVRAAGNVSDPQPAMGGEERDDDERAAHD